MRYPEKIITTASDVCFKANSHNMPKVPIFRCPKMGLRAAESKNGDYFFTPTSSQNGGIYISFMSLLELENSNFDFFGHGTMPSIISKS